MLRKLVNDTIFIFLIVCVFLLAIYQQSFLMLNLDVSWLSEVSKRMLQGGSYSTTFFENNPPWIFYFYIPPVIAAKLTHISILYTMRVYIFILAAISLRISYYFLQLLFSKKDPYLVRLLTMILAILFIVLPGYNLGQRENLLFTLSMPYFFMLALRLENHKINRQLAIAVGLLAGSAFIMKPYFLIPLFLVEIYYLSVKKNLIESFRAETITILVLAITYLAIILFRHSDYLTTVMPYAARWCYYGSARPLVVLLASAQISFAAFSFLIVIMTIEINPYKKLTKVLILALTGFILAFIMQRVNYPYRYIPLYSMSIFIVAFLYSLYVTTEKKIKYIDVMVWSLIFLTSVYFIQYLLQYFGSDNHLFICYLVCVMAWVIYLIPNQKNKKNLIAISVLPLLIFCIPFYSTYVSYVNFRFNKKMYSNLVSYIDTHAAHQQIYFFNTDLVYTYPMVLYTHDTQSASRFSGFWMLGGLLKQYYFPMSAQRHAQWLHDKNMLGDLIAQDLALKKPKFLYCDDLDEKSMLYVDVKNSRNRYEQKFIPLNYQQFFSDNLNLQRELKKYRYQTTIERKALVPIIPVQYQFVFANLKNDDMEEDHLYFYTNPQGQMEMALKDAIFGKIKKYELSATTLGMSPQEFIEFENAVNRAASLSPRQKQFLLAWVAKQTIKYEFYKIKIYTRV